MKEIQIMQGRQKGAIQKLGGIPVGEFSMGEFIRAAFECGIKFNGRGWRIYRTPSFDICTAAIKIFLVLNISN